MLREFRDFVNRGNFVDIAVAFVMGAAFGAVTTTLTQRVVGPLVGLLVEVDLEGWGTFGPTNPETNQPAGSVGAFLEALVNFVIVAAAMFLVVKAYNRFRERHSGEPAAEEDVSEPEDVVLLRQIRDSLRAAQPGGGDPAAS